MTHVVELEPVEWQQVISALAMTNPVLMKISQQLSRQQQELVQGNAPKHEAGYSGLHPGNSKEPSHGL